MILEVDMGNTRLKWRLRSPVARLAAGSIPTGADHAVLGEILEKGDAKVDRVLVASVRGDEEERALADWISNHLEVTPEFARSATSCGLVTNGYANPSSLGVDRWLAVVAGYHQVRNACVIASAGTALTVDLVAGDGRHLGGYIAPGVNLFGATLSQSTARISLNEATLNMALPPGKETASAVSNACAAMIRGIIDNALEQLRLLDDSCEKIDLLVTGGDAALIQRLYPWAAYNQELVLDGLGYHFGLRSIISGESR